MKDHTNSKIAERIVNVAGDLSNEYRYACIVYELCKSNIYT
jgi:hypothetical protein